MARCIAAYLGPELPDELRGFKDLIWIRAVRLVELQEELAKAAAEIASGHHDCVALTSPRSPNMLRRFLEKWPSEARPFCVGQGTARSFAEAYGVPCEAPKKGGTSELARLMIARGCREVLTLRAAEGDDELESSLRRSGAKVVRINVYNEVVDPQLLTDVVQADVIIVSSQVMARSLCGTASNTHSKFVAIGPKSAEAVRSLCPGAEVIASPEPYFRSIARILKDLGCG